MNQPQKSYILSVDDDPLSLKIVEKVLASSGHEVICHQHSSQALEEIRRHKPALILLDIMMPGMNGYDFCGNLQKDPQTSDIPVIFLTSLENEQDKARAFALGAADYLSKPFSGPVLLQKINSHLKMNERWRDLSALSSDLQEQVDPSKFSGFKEALARELKLPEEMKNKTLSFPPSQFFSLPSEVGITPKQMAMKMANFLKVPYLPLIDPADILLGVLPNGFCRTHSVVPVKGKKSKFAFVLGNPFNLELADALKKFTRQAIPLEILITEKRNIEILLGENGTEGFHRPLKPGGPFPEGDRGSTELTHVVFSREDAHRENHPIISLTSALLESAANERASDIHIEPKEKETVVRLRVDGDMVDFWHLEKETGSKLVSRMKALAAMDITERRKPQDGSVDAIILKKQYKLRLATASTPSGESLTIRILDPSKKPKTLEQLGMSPEQVKLMTQFANRTAGLIMVVGPTGSGKTTTLYSLLSQIDCQMRTLISVEDPVEYRIPFANQQQVNQKAGVTFEVLLKSLVRQDPDILFIGEVRDPYSAKIAMDFASTGHLTLTTLHTTNATTAIFRLERLEVSRGIMADSILAIVAQRLIKMLCPSCKKIEPITHEEMDLLSPFTSDIPTHLAHPVGCQYCQQTGYGSREGIYEVIHCDPAVADMIRHGRSISEIRQFIHQRGNPLISQQAIEKVKNFTFSLKDVYERVLLEENPSTLKSASALSASVGGDQTASPPEPSLSRILVVEDDAITQKVVTHFLQKEGFEVVTADDGVDALIKMGQSRFDLILSDINIPNLDGFKLLEMIQQKGLGIPVILMTGRISPEDEVRGLEMGATDYLRKPVQKELLLLRVRRTLQNVSSPGGEN